MACVLLHPEISQPILLGLAVTVVIIAAVMTGGLSLIPTAAIALGAGALTGGAGFFAMKALDDKTEDVTAENSVRNTSVI